MALTDFTARPVRIQAPDAKSGFSLMQVIAVWRSRRALANLDSHALNDIGINAKRAAAEAAKPIWDVPTTWRT